MNSYLNWVIENTKIAWWHDSADSKSVLNSTDGFSLTKIPGKVAVIGGGYVGILSNFDKVAARITVNGMSACHRILKQIIADSWRTLVPQPICQNQATPEKMPAPSTGVIPGTAGFC